MTNATGVGADAGGQQDIVSNGLKGLKGLWR